MDKRVHKDRKEPVEENSASADKRRAATMVANKKKVYAIRLIKDVLIL